MLESDGRGWGDKEHPEATKGFATTGGYAMRMTCLRRSIGSTAALALVFAVLLVATPLSPVAQVTSAINGMPAWMAVPATAKGGSTTPGIVGYYSFANTFDNIVRPGRAMSATGVEFVHGASVHLNGISEFAEGGYSAITEVFDTLDLHTVSFLVDFKRDGDGSESRMPVIFGGPAYRWLGLVIRDGQLEVLLNNSTLAFAPVGMAVTPGQWHRAGVALDLHAGRVSIALDGGAAQGFDLPADFELEVIRDRDAVPPPFDPPFYHGDRRLTFTDYSRGETFKGFCDTLVVLDRALSDEELAAFTMWLPSLDVRAPVVVTLRGRSAGSLDGVEFPVSDFTLTTLAHTGSRSVYDSSPFIDSFGYSLDDARTSIEIAGLGRFDILSPTTRIFVNNRIRVAGLSRGYEAGGGDLLNFYDRAEFSSWDMMTSFGPAPVTSLSVCTECDYATPAGPLRLTGIESTALFEAQVVSAQSEPVPLTSANDDSLAPASDAAGRYVVFQSRADDLRPDGSSDVDNIYRVDTLTGQRELLSRNTDGTPLAGAAIEPSVTADGEAAVFVAADAGIGKLLGESSKTTRSRAKGSGFSVLLRNMLTGTTRRLPVPAQPEGVGTGPQISAGGNGVVYSAPLPAEHSSLGAVGQIEVFRIPLSRQVDGDLVPGEPACVSCKARDADGNAMEDSQGNSRAPTLSADGNWVAFETTAKNLTVGNPSPCAGNSGSEVMLRNMLTGTLRRLGAPPGAGQCGDAAAGSGRPRMDWSGNRIVFESTQPLDAQDGNSDADVYLYDLAQDRLSRVSRSQGGGASVTPTISGDGQIVAFVSSATDLDPLEADANGGIADVHVVALRDASLRRLSRSRNGDAADSDSRRPALNYNGTAVLFDSDAGNLAATSAAGVQNVYQRGNPLNAGKVFGAGFE